MTYLIAYVAMVIGAICTLIAVAAMQRGAKHNIGTLGWLFLVLLTPPIGLVLFLAFSGKKISAEHDARATVDLPSGARPADAKHGEIAVKRGLPPPSLNNSMVILTDPQAMHAALFDLIESAQNRLFLLSFILIDDEVGNQIIDRLCEKARSGVQVRLMVDGVGSFLFPTQLLDKVTQAGGVAARFKPLNTLSRFAYANFRNHRKMAIADGRRAIVGGANLVEYEMTDTPDDDTWVSHCMDVTGDAARQVEATFLSDWNFATEEGLQPTEEDPVAVDESASDHAILQVIPVGPDGLQEILDDVWITSINRANHRVWISTPYFVPPPMAIRSLAMAVRRGVDVRVLYPDESDVTPADYARRDYVWDLHELGGKVYRLREKMIHAKLLIVDDSAAYVGSANFDMRSFSLNYELVIGVFNQRKIDELSQWFIKQTERCVEGPRPDTTVRKTLGLLTRIFGEQL